MDKGITFMLFFWVMSKSAMSILCVPFGEHMWACLLSSLLGMELLYGKEYLYLA